MRYTVIWHPSAIDDLLRLWTDGPDRKAVTDATNGIESTLRIDPVLRGETLAGSIRILIAPPLQVAYRILEDDRTVQILAVRRAIEVDEPS